MISQEDATAFWIIHIEPPAAKCWRQSDTPGRSSARANGAGCSNDGEPLRVHKSWKGVGVASETKKIN